MLYDVSAEKVRIRSLQAFKGIPRNKTASITYDNGSEFSDYELTEKQLGVAIYFAHPYHSWERGTSENTNGLLRRYYPKGTLFSNIKKEEFNDVVQQINLRPRKRLGNKSPHEEFYGVNFRILM